jgi:hypothetical protein
MDETQPEVPSPVSLKKLSAKERAIEIMKEELNLTVDHAERILQQLERRGILVHHDASKSGIGGL